MKTCHIEASALIQAPAARVYTILADFNNHHGKITPKPWFGPATVEQGGFGAGTVLRFQMHVLGRTIDCHSTVAEPEPGRVMVETERTSGTVTTFTVDPRDGGSCQVTIASEYKLHVAPFGWIEREMLNRAIPPIYREELRLLGEYAASNSANESRP